MDTIWLIEEKYWEDYWEERIEICAPLGFFHSYDEAKAVADRESKSWLKSYANYVKDVEKKNKLKDAEKKEYDKQKAFIEAAGMTFRGNRNFTPHHTYSFEDWSKMHEAKSYRVVQMELHTD